MAKKYTIVGIDEAGRGPLAGPVVAASVLIDEKYLPYGINDSKKISEKNRETFYTEILEKSLKTVQKIHNKSFQNPFKFDSKWRKSSQGVPQRGDEKRK